MELRLKPFLKGAMSFVIPSLRTVRASPPGSSKKSAEDAEFCYSIFLRHYSHAAPHFTRRKFPLVVAELGPGSSFGIGLCALIFGANTYYALDVVDYTNPELNLRVFDELVRMFRARHPVPRDDTTFPEPVSYEFPRNFVMPEDIRLEAIRRDLREKAGRFLRVAVPWNDADIPRNSIGWLWSHSVMEHIDEIGHAWECCAHWLTMDGIITHEIDYRSHNLTHSWNGHWAIGQQQWAIIRGKRPYLLNRLPHSAQMTLATNAGLEIVSEHGYHPGDGIPAIKILLAGIQKSDQLTGMAFVVMKHANHASFMSQITALRNQVDGRLTLGE
jgi:hypothetical protein